MKKMLMAQGIKLGSEKRGRWLHALLPKLALACVAGCSLQTWEKPQEVGEETTVGVVTEALGSTTQAAYVVTVDGFDAYCNGVLHTGSHTDAIQSCIDLASADGGARVVLRAGSYWTGTWPLTLKSNVTLAGEGRFTASLQPPSVTQIIGTMQDGSAIEGIRFALTSVTEGAIRLGASAGPHSNLRIENNLFEASGSNPDGQYFGIYAPNGANSFNRIVVRGNSFQAYAPNFNPVYLRVTSGSGTINSLHVQDNDFVISNTGSGSAIYLAGETSTTPSRGIVVSGNSIRTTTATRWIWGVFLQGTLDALVTGNTIQAVAGGVGIHPGAAASCGAVVTANDFRGGYTASVSSQCAPTSTVVGNSTDSANTSIGANPILVRAYLNADLGFNGGVEKVLLYNATDVNNSGVFNTSNGTFVAPAAGVYRTRACARKNFSGFTAGSTSDMILKVNGSVWATSRVVSGGTSSFTNCVEDLVVLAAGASLQVTVNSSGTGARTIVGSRTATYLNIERVSD